MRWRVELIVSDEIHGAIHLRPQVFETEVEAATPLGAIAVAARAFHEQKVHVDPHDVARFSFQKL